MIGLLTPCPSEQCETPFVSQSWKLQCHFQPTLLVEADTSSPRLEGRRHRRYLSMGGSAKSLWPCFKTATEPRIVVHTCNPSNQVAETGWLLIWDEPELHRETLSQKQKRITPKKVRKQNNKIQQTNQPNKTPNSATDTTDSIQDLVFLRFLFLCTTPWRWWEAPCRRNTQKWGNLSFWYLKPVVESWELADSPFFHSFAAANWAFRS
jgi:hypothetical protein